VRSATGSPNAAVRTVLLLCAASAIAAGKSRPLVKFGLLDAAFGATSNLVARSDNPPAVLHMSFLELGAGVRSGDHPGFAVGTALLEGDVMDYLSLLPLRGWLMYDIDPGRTLRSAMVYLSAAYDWCIQDGWSGNQLDPGFRFAGGMSYTFYAVTPHAELGYDVRQRRATLTAGLALGGTYVFRQRGG